MTLLLMFHSAIHLLWKARSPVWLAVFEMHPQNDRPPHYDAVQWRQFLLLRRACWLLPHAQLPLLQKYPPGQKSYFNQWAEQITPREFKPLDLLLIFTSITGEEEIARHNDSNNVIPLTELSG